MKKSFFDKEQQIIFRRLRRALPNCYIFPKVDLIALLKPINVDSKAKRAEQVDLEGRKIDFAIFDSYMHLLCVIELNSEVGEDGKYLTNTSYFKTAGIKTIRWERRALPLYEQILRTVAPFSALTAPKPDIAPSTVARAQLV
ncbi:DUF2726 domain-containing protein, partial [Undibacterium sp. 10I3]